MHDEICFSLQPCQWVSKTQWPIVAGSVLCYPLMHQPGNTTRGRSREVAVAQADRKAADADAQEALEKAKRDFAHRAAELDRQARCAGAGQGVVGRVGWCLRCFGVVGGMVVRVLRS